MHVFIPFVYGIGPYFLETTKKKYDKSSFDTERNLAHGLTEKKSNNVMGQEVEQLLNTFFNDLKEEGDETSEE